MIWRLFHRKAEPDRWTAWWQEADRVALSASEDAIARLAEPLGDLAPEDDVEPQEEMVEGLRALVALSARTELPVVPSQHRVVGSDACHIIAPVTLTDGSPAKLFLTSRRLVLVSGGVTTRHWPAAGRPSRDGRRLTFGSGEGALVVQCNTFGEALSAQHVASRLSSGGRRL